MRIVFLGTNGWYDTSTGKTSCVLVETDRYLIIFDAGSGLQHLDTQVNIDRPVFIFLSHFHLDHIYGFHIINKFKFTYGLTLCGPSNIKSILGLIVNEPFSFPLSVLKPNVQYVELPDEHRKLPFQVESLPLIHSSYTLGYRVVIDGKVLTYCTDTGYCANAVTLGRQADILITECAFKSGMRDDTWPHLDPQTAARIAKEACASSLYLMHFDADLYRTIEEREQAGREAKLVFPVTMFATDKMVVHL